MNKTYIISDATIIHPEKGEIKKQKITYLSDGKEETVELYSQEGFVAEIREGYEPDEKNTIEAPKKKNNLSGIDIDTLTDEQLMKLKERLSKL